MHSYRDIEMKTIIWAMARKIIPNSTPVAQARKTLEEAGELLEAAARLDAGDKTAIAAYRDAVGDVVVTLVNGCALADVDLVDCFYGSFQEIKDRKGTLMPSGVFVKACSPSAPTAANPATVFRTAQYSRRSHELQTRTYPNVAL